MYLELSTDAVQSSMCTKCEVIAKDCPSKTASLTTKASASNASLLALISEPSSDVPKMLRRRGSPESEMETVEGEEEALLEAASDPRDDKAAEDNMQFYWNFGLLVLLYCLQGIPLGLAGGSLPFLLKAAGASYSTVGLFSLALLPFSAKLLWAPVVDGYWVASLGRRKTWIVPCQVVSGLFMLATAGWMDEWIRSGSMMLALVFFLLVLAFATQDIAVDGWALELLSEHLAYASTAQSVGQNIGFFCGFTVFLGAQSFGWITLAQFVRVWGIVFVACSAALYAFKHEAPPSNLIRIDSVSSVYRQLWQISRLPDVRRFVLFLMTYQLGLAANDKALHLRLIEAGFSKEFLATLGLVGLPLSVGFAVATGRWARGGRPMSGPFLLGNWIRIVTGMLGMGLVWWIGEQKQSSPSVMMTGIVLGLFSVGTLGSTLVFVSICAFFNEISPKSIGGTYLTMLNTVSNLGKAWAGPPVLSLIDVFGFGTVNVLLLLGGAAYLAASRPYLTRIEDASKMEWSSEVKV